MTGIYVGPVEHPLLSEAVTEAGGTLTAIEDAEAVVWTDPFAVPELLGRLTVRIRWVSLPVAGVDHFLAAGVIDDTRVWTATKGVYGDAVAEHALTLLLACSRHLVAAARRRTWTADPGWRLRGETVAVLGTGGIGAAAATKLAAFGARTIGVNRSGAFVDGFTEVVDLARLGEVLTSARAVIVALPYTPATKGLLGEAEFDAVGADGALVNVARGEIVKTEALVHALQTGRLGAAGLDVTDPEPLPDGHPLWDMPNVIITAHTANPATRLPWEPNIVEYAAHVARNVHAFANGTPLDGRIDTALGY